MGESNMFGPTPVQHRATACGTAWTLGKTMGGTSAIDDIPVCPSDAILIESGGAGAVYWGDLWRHRELLYFLVWRDVIIRYKQTVVGVAWAVIRPLTTTLVMVVVFANKVSARDRAIAECARVLEPGGTFVAATLADENLSDLWEFLGSPRDRRLTFSTVNGAAQLEPYFERVEAREVESVVVFPSPDAMRAYVSANMTRAHLAAAVPAAFDEPVRARTHHTVFVAHK